MLIPSMAEPRDASASCRGAAATHGPTGTTLSGAYELLVLCYLGSLLYAYPYGVPIADEVNLRVSDLFAMLALLFGIGVVAVRGRIHVDRAFLFIAGAFVFLELTLPLVGAVGYRRPVDVVSSVKMAMLWLPMILLGMLAPTWSKWRFERNLTRLLVLTLWLNFYYAILQVAAAVGAVPRSLLITEWLEPWTVDRGFNVLQGLRPAGFFNNSTGLSVFGIVSLCHFYSRYILQAERRDLVRTLVAVSVVVLTTSRVAYAACACILFAGWWHLSSGRRSLLAMILVCGVSSLLFLVERTIGIETAFDRFQRLAESGLLEDDSFGARVYRIWPTALAAARDYVLGTFIQTPRALPLVDSGYLTYYLQGKWPFVAALAVLLGGLWYRGLREFLGRVRHHHDLVLLFIGTYLTIALVTSNPLRSPLMIFFIAYAFWRLDVEGRMLPLRIPSPSIS